MHKNALPFSRHVTGPVIVHGTPSMRAFSGVPKLMVTYSHTVRLKKDTSIYRNIGHGVIEEEKGQELLFCIFFVRRGAH